MRTIERTGQFKRDYKREKKARHRTTLDVDLARIVTALADDQPLDVRYRDHPLSGEWSDHRDCHVRPDLVLITISPMMLRWYLCASGHMPSLDGSAVATCLLSCDRAA